MTKPGDLPTTKKTMHELSKEFPEASYRNLEIYRDADRQEEAQQIPLTESQKKQEELEPIQEEAQQILIKEENKELKEDQLKKARESGL